MAPARMVQFIKQHVASCPVCREDPALQEEIDKITEIILPESKIPKAVRLKQEMDDEDDYDEEVEDASDDGEEEESDDDEESDLDDDFNEDEEEPLDPEDEDDY